MGSELSPKWRRLYKQALGKAEGLTKELRVSDIPVALLPIARALHAQVTFKPLLVEGAIGVVKGGFEIFVHATSDEARNLQACFDNPADGGRSFSPRRRFTIAHELAHAFFFDWMGNGQKPKPLASGGRAAELDRIESGANRYAGFLLVPDHLLASTISAPPIDVLDPMSIRNLAGEFRVSLDCLIIRLQKHVARKAPGGGIALITTHGTELNAHSWALDGTGKRLFTDNYGELDISAFASALRHPVSSDETATSEAFVPCTVGGRQTIQRVSLAAVLPSTSSVDNRLLVTMRLVGTPELMD